MNDVLRMRGLECIGNLPGKGERFVNRDRTACYAVPQRWAFDEFEHDAARARRLFKPVHGGDVGMIQGREHFGFALKTRQAIGIVRESGWQNLDGDVALQACVTRAIHLAHAAGAEHRVDFIRTETRTAFERHACAFYPVWLS